MDLHRYDPDSDDLSLRDFIVTLFFGCLGMAVVIVGIAKFAQSTEPWGALWLLLVPVGAAIGWAGEKV